MIRTRLLPSYSRPSDCSSITFQTIKECMPAMQSHQWQRLPLKGAAIPRLPPQVAQQAISKQPRRRGGAMLGVQGGPDLAHLMCDHPA